jgi:hypothetical protein
MVLHVSRFKVQKSAPIGAKTYTYVEKKMAAPLHQVNIPAISRYSYVLLRIKIFFSSINTTTHLKQITIFKKYHKQHTDETMKSKNIVFVTWTTENLKAGTTL